MAKVGISFFEYQVRYDKGGSEMSFGMLGPQTSELQAFVKSGRVCRVRFGLGAQKIASMNFFGVPFPVWCLPESIDAHGVCH